MGGTCPNSSTCIDVINNLWRSYYTAIKFELTCIVETHEEPTQYEDTSYNLQLTLSVSAATSPLAFSKFAIASLHDVDFAMAAGLSGGQTGSQHPPSLIRQRLDTPKLQRLPCRGHNLSGGTNDHLKSKFASLIQVGLPTLEIQRLSQQLDFKHSPCKGKHAALTLPADASEGPWHSTMDDNLCSKCPC